MTVNWHLSSLSRAEIQTKVNLPICSKVKSLPIVKYPLLMTYLSSKGPEKLEFQETHQPVLRLNPFKMNSLSIRLPLSWPKRTWEQSLQNIRIWYQFGYLLPLTLSCLGFFHTKSWKFKYQTRFLRNLYTNAKSIDTFSTNLGSTVKSSTLLWNGFLMSITSPLNHWKFLWKRHFTQEFSQDQAGFWNFGSQPLKSKHVITGQTRNSLRQLKYDLKQNFPPLILPKLLKASNLIK